MASLAVIEEIEERIFRRIEELRNRNRDDRLLIENLDRDVVVLFGDLRRRNGEHVVRLFTNLARGKTPTNSFSSFFRGLVKLMKL
jgi:hypothetical protein